MAFVHHHQKIIWEVIQQCKGWLSVHPPINMHRIVLNTVAIPNFSHHLKVVLRALPQPLSLKQFALILKLLQSWLQLCLDLQHRPLHALVAGNIVRRRKNHCLLKVLQCLTCYRIDNGDSFDCVAEHLETRHCFVICRVNFDGVASHAEVATTKS